MSGRLPSRKRHLAHSQSQSQSQPQSQSQLNSQSQQNAVLENFDEVVNNTVCFLLAHNSTLRPIKKAEIFQNVSNGTQIKGKLAADILKAVKQKLAHVYGLDLVEAESQKYILVNSGEDRLMQSELVVDTGGGTVVDSGDGDEDSDQTIYEPPMEISGQRGDSNKVLLLLILAAIYHSDFSISEDSLIGFLQKLNIDLKSKDPYFGDVLKKIQEFERQMYFKKTMQEVDIVDSEQDGGGSKTKMAHYTWGQRSTLEIGKKAVFNFLTKVYDRDPQQMPPSFIQALEEDHNA